MANRGHQRHSMSPLSVRRVSILRQLRRVQQSLDADSTKMFVHAFITSWVDYCNAVFAGSPQYITDTLQCALNAAACLITCTHKYNCRLSTLLNDQLHWLNVLEQVEYKLALMVRWCVKNKAPRYLVECCTLVVNAASRRRRSANLHRLTVPQYRRSTIGRRAFSVGGPSVWNSLPVELCEPTVSCRDFHCTLKTILFAQYYRQCIQHNRDALCKITLHRSNIDIDSDTDIKGP